VRFRQGHGASGRQGYGARVAGPALSDLTRALGEQACRKGFRVQYVRLPRLLEELQLAHADGTYARLLGRLLRNDLLILDDWGLGALTEAQSRDVLEVLKGPSRRKGNEPKNQNP
jgi:DNA replication protein DnaC